MSKVPTTLALLGVTFGIVPTAQSHCEIPCGIYNDKMRVVMLQEDITTVDKSMREIDKLGAQKKPVWNQLVRWVTNKEHHAGRIQETVTQYFMTQRVKVPSQGKPTDDRKYLEQLTTLHSLLVTAMKMKQTTDLTLIKTARELVDRFAAAYFNAEDLEHLRKHHAP